MHLHTNLPDRASSIHHVLGVTYGMSQIPQRGCDATVEQEAAQLSILQRE
jgi:hypothetical protein